MLGLQFKQDREDLPKKRTYYLALEGGRKKAMFKYERKRFQKKGKVSAKAQRPEYTWQVEERV